MLLEVSRRYKNKIGRKLVYNDDLTGGEYLSVVYILGSEAIIYEFAFNIMPLTLNN
jgi:hypothetical protein